jgi:hypothetical protein
MAKQCAVEFFYELDEPVWILLTARCFREYTPILQLSFHPYTSVGWFQLDSCISRAKTVLLRILYNLAELGAGFGA